MADNTTLPAGTADGDVYASDDIGGVKFQRVKLVHGADGVNDGDVSSANGLPVVGPLTDTELRASAVPVSMAAVPTGGATEAKQDTGNTSLSSIDGKVPALGQALAAASVPVVLTAAQLTTLTPVSTVTANAGTNLNTSALALEAGGNLAAAATSLAVMDDWDESDRLKVNLIAGQVGIAGGTGTDGATVPRVTLATNVALPAGTNAIGKLAANTGVDIGDVDVTSIVPGTGATNLGKAEDAGHTTGDVGVMALGVRAASPTERSAGPTDGDYEPFATNEVGAVWVSVTPSANGGCSTMNATSSDGATALTSTAQAIKASAGQLYGYYIYNPNATAQFVQFYNTASGSVTVGTTNPLFMLTIPATAAANLMGENGITFSTAMSWAATSTAGGNGAPSTALDAVCWYK